VPDLPEQSRAPREGQDPRSDGSEVLPERRAVETPRVAPPFDAPLDALGVPANGAHSGNGSSTRIGDALTLSDLPERDGETATGDAGDGGDDDAGDGEGEGGAEHARRPRRSGWRSAIEWALVIGGALLVALVVRTFLVQAFWIPSASMEPTLHEGDRVLVNKLSYDLHDVHHGDVIVFERPDEPSDVPHPEDEIPDLIKRVIGLPGDVIEARDGIVYINDERIDEPYLAPDTPTTDLPRQEVPEGKLFVMGDNRTNSHDSRRFGPIDESSIVGRAFLRIYPLDDIGGL
jgi:signal peptidase I